jgi:hypothetical protein
LLRRVACLGQGAPDRSGEGDHRSDGLSVAVSNQPRITTEKIALFQTNHHSYFRYPEITAASRAAVFLPSP